MEELYINKLIIDNTLSIIFNNFNKYFNLVDELDILLNINNYSNIIYRYYIDSTKIFRYFDLLVSKQDLLEYYKELQLAEDDIQKISDTLNMFIEYKLIIRLSKKDMDYYPYESEKYIITPVGTYFLINSLKLFEKGYDTINFTQVFNDAIENMGISFNKLILERIKENLKSIGSNLNKQEIVFVLYLLLTESISKDKAIHLARPVNRDLTIPLNYISNYVFDVTLFDSRTIDEWIRRTTSSSGLRAKVFNKYNKEDMKDINGYLIYLDLEEEIIGKFMNQIIKAIENINDKDSIVYYKKIVSLIDTYINEQSILYGVNPQISYKIIKHRITTLYLTRILSLFKQFI